VNRSKNGDGVGLPTYLGLTRSDLGPCLHKKKIKLGGVWDCVSRVCGGGGGVAGGGVPLGAMPVLSWCGEVSLGG